MPDRPIPTPRVLANRTTPTPPPAVPRRQPAFDRHAWEGAVLDSELGLPERAVALLLAHRSGPAGYLPPGGPQRLGRLARDTRLSREGVRRALTALVDAGFLQRPDIHAWHSRRIWPLTLTMPPAPGEGEPAEPPSPRAAS